MPTRGAYRFDISNDGHVLDSIVNLDRLRRMFLDRDLVNNALGPGDPGDFDHGSWHILCHLVAACGVYRGRRGPVIVALAHDGTVDRYFCSATFQDANAEMQTVPISQRENHDLLQGLALVGYVEGTSEGRISAKEVCDPPETFNRNPRQEYDQPPESQDEGGTVWEHWCTTRDIRAENVIGNSVLAAYLTLVSTLGGEFVAVVARGRREHDHPMQLCGMVHAGFITREDALSDITPTEIPKPNQHAFCQATATDGLRAVRNLGWDSAGHRRYYMFSRRSCSWSTTEQTKQELNRYFSCDRQSCNI